MNPSHLIATILFTLFMIGSAAGDLIPPSPDDGSGIDPDEVVIHWPSTDFATIQEAIDALPDGGRLIISPGKFRIPAPITISREVAIQGAGCRLASQVDFQSRSLADLIVSLSDAGNSDLPFTRLIGPRPTDVTDPEASVGLFNYIGPDAGGILTGLELVGYDAGLKINNLPDPTSVGGEPSADSDPAAAEPLTVTDSCIVGSGRGILANTTAPIALVRTVIRNVLWNGVSYTYPSSQLRQHIGLTMESVAVFQARNACVYFNNTVGVMNSVFLSRCGPQGVVGAIDSHLSINHSWFTKADGPGVILLGSSVYIGDTRVDETTGYGIYLSDSYLQSHNNLITQTQRFSSLRFGDGITAFNQSTAVLNGNRIIDSSRAAISNFASNMALSDNTLQCAAFELEAEDIPPDNYNFSDLGGNVCGCPVANGKCVTVSVGLEPPDPVMPSQ